MNDNLDRRRLPALGERQPLSANQAIYAGQMAALRKRVRELFLDGSSIVLNCRTKAGKDTSLVLDPSASKAALEALDLDLSNRLGALGVSE